MRGSTGLRCAAPVIAAPRLGRVRAIATGSDGLPYALMTDPTGPGYNINFTEPVRGELVRPDAITWKQMEYKFQ